MVTGATGTLGRAVLPALHRAGHRVHIVTRRTMAAGRSDADTTDPRHADVVTVADLVTGAGVHGALSGAQVVVHLATTNGSRDVRMMANLLAEAARQGVARLLYLSIVGCDRIPLAYYRHKAAAEQLALSSGLTVTVQRSTQFHQLAERLFTVQRHLPALVVPAIPLQPIDTRDVAARLLELVTTAPHGRVPDIGGPDVARLAELARLWQTAHQRHRPVIPLRVPGRTFAGYTAGHHLVPGQPYGHRSFAQYLTDPGS